MSQIRRKKARRAGYHKTQITYPIDVIKLQEMPKIVVCNRAEATRDPPKFQRSLTFYFLSFSM
jgi:hypothetical protein